MNKKIILSLSVIGVVAAIAIGGTIAYFSDTETAKANIISAGTIDIAVNDENPWNKTYTDELKDMKPSQVRYIEFKVENVGTNPARVWKHIGNIVTNDGVNSEPECTEGNGTWDNATKTCGGSYAAEYNIDTVIDYDMYVCLVGGDCAVDNTGKPTGTGWNVIVHPADGMTMADIESTWMDLMEWRPANKGLEKNEKIIVVQSYHMRADTGNWAQGDTLTYNIDLLAQQMNAPEVRSTTLLMENKDTSWQVIKGDGKWGVLKYDKTTKAFTFSGYVVDPAIQYKFVHWNDPNEVVIDGKQNLIPDSTTGYLSFSGTLPSGLKDAKIWLRPQIWSPESNLKTLWEYELIDTEQFRFFSVVFLVITPSFLKKEGVG